MTYQHPEIGKINFITRNNQKRVLVKYKPFSGVECSIPRTVSPQTALKYIEKNKEWIQSQRIKYEHLFQHKLATFEINLIYNQIKCEFGKGKFKVNYKADKSLFLIDIKPFSPVEEPHKYEWLVRMLNEIIKKEAQLYLPQRLNALAKKHDFSYNQVRTKNISSRWGSCSYVNNINLNAHLVRLPKHLRDYVLLHELTHTIHKNHGSIFWEKLDKVLDGKAKTFDKELNSYRTNIFL